MDRLNQLEEMFAHQDLQLHELGEVVLRQGDELALLKAQLSKLNGKIEAESDPALAMGGAQDKPPHY